MPNPTIKAVKQSLSTLKKGKFFQKNFSTIARAFALTSEPGPFLLRISDINKKLAETLIVFRKRLREAAANDAGLETAIDQAYLHYIVNTDGSIPEGKEDDPFNVFEAATRYAKWLSVGVSEGDGGTSLLAVDDKKVPGPKWDILSNWSAALALRKVGPTINRLRYGRDDIIPSFAFGFDENAEGHTLQNAITLADFSHLAYFGPTFVEKQLKQWGYDAFRWVEDKETDTQAFVTGKDTHLIVSFRGTSSKKDALVDTRFRKTDAFGGRGRVHRGFHSAMDSVWNQVQAAVDELGADKKIFICGHSLGAALAQLAAHRLALESYSVAAVYVYGSPRIGNPEFRDAYNELLEDKTFLHINNRDIVTQIPPRILGFRHLGGGPRLFDDGHVISKMPKPRSLGFFEEEEVDFESLDEETQAAILQQMEEAQKSMEASASFLDTPPDQLENVNSRGLFDIKPVDDHSMDLYLFKFGCAIVDGEWERIGGEKVDE